MFKVIWTLLSHSCPDIWVSEPDWLHFPYNPSQLVDIDFKVYNVWEGRKIKQDMVFLETGWKDQKKRQGPKRKQRDPLGTNQCAYCKEEGNWRKECLKFKWGSRDENPCWKMLKRQRESDDEWGGPGSPLDISQPITLSPQEPLVRLVVVNKRIYFLIDMGATYSVLHTNVTKEWLSTVIVTGVTGQL